MDDKKQDFTVSDRRLFTSESVTEGHPDKVADAIYAFYTSKGYTMSQQTFRKALSFVDVEPGFPSDLRPYMQEQAEVLLKEKKISAIPDWSKALRPDFMEKAKAGV